jgi:hypothetical protein
MSYLKRYVRATSIAEFLRYAFTPSFGVIMWGGAYAGLWIMAVLLFVIQPLVAATILIGYTAFFALAMVLSFIQFRRYKNHYNKVFDK